MSTTGANMAPMEAEVKELEGMKDQMITIVTNIISGRPKPIDISLIAEEPIDPIHWPHRFRFQASFKVTFETRGAMVLKFPLKSRIHPDIMPKMIQAEVAAMGWARNHCALPIPKVRGFDYKAHYSWNTTRRPWILVDHMPGKHITNKGWEQMTDEQKHRVIAAVANVVAALSLHSFDKIGSPFPKDQKLNAWIGPLITYPLSLYTLLHGDSRQKSKLFETRNSPYPTAVDYLVDIANKHLIHRVINSPSDLSTDYVEMWMYRSLLPGIVWKQYNQGPFVLTHGFLDRSALLFDDEYKLTGVINWEWSQTEPLQLAASLPPFLINLPISRQSQEFSNLGSYYIKALEQYEKDLRGNKTERSKAPPPLHQIALHEDAYLLPNAGLVAEAGQDSLSEALWRYIFVPTFGLTDKRVLLGLFTKAPGLVEEHKRTREFLQSLQTSLTLTQFGAPKPPTAVDAAELLAKLQLVTARGLEFRTGEV